MIIINTDMRYNFDKYPRSTIDSLNTPYDYGSIMHYGPTAFGQGRTTIVPKNKGVFIKTICAMWFPFISYLMYVNLEYI
jgi:hypothetical protein